MRKAAIFSAAMHVTLLGAMYVGLPIFHDPEPIESAPIIEVEFAPLAALTNPPEPEVKPEPEKKPEPPKPEPPKPDVAHDPPPPLPETKIAAVPPKPEPEPEPEPAPEPPKPEKKAEPKPPEPKPEKKVEQKPPPKPKTRPRPVAEKPKEKKKKNFDTKRIAALLDKSAKDKPEPPKQNTLDKIEERLKKSERSAPRSARRTEAPVTQGEYDRIKLHIIRHWNPNRGAPGAESMVVRIRIHLRRDGSLDGRPKIIEENAAGQSEQVFRPFADSAVRAVLRSNPLPVPLEKYEAWREIEFTFSLKDMLG
jgi:hypothetical protein